MSCHHIDFVAFDLAREGHRGSAIDDPLTQELDHRPNVILVQVEFLGDLQAREVQSHEIQADDPGPQRLAVVGEDGAGEVVEPLPTSAALVALAVGLGVVSAVLDDRGGRTPGASHAVGPTHGPDRLVALGVVDEVLDVHHRSMARERVKVRVEGTESSTTKADCNDSAGDLDHHPAIHHEPRSL
jgi:hypothetical protein